MRSIVYYHIETVIHFTNKIVQWTIFWSFPKSMIWRAPPLTLYFVYIICVLFFSNLMMKNKRAGVGYYH